MSRKNEKVLLCLAAFAAVLLGVFLFTHLLGLRSELHILNDSLTESYTHWNAVADEKEAYQDILADTRDELKEATVSYGEAVDKVNRRREEITQLENEISAMD